MVNKHICETPTILLIEKSVKVKVLSIKNSWKFAFFIKLLSQ